MPVPDAIPDRQRQRPVNGAGQGAERRDGPESGVVSPTEKEVDDGNAGFGIGPMGVVERASMGEG